MTRGTSSEERVVVALYRFVKLEDFESLRQPLLSVCEKAGVKGTLLLAHEGVNGTIAGSRGAVDSVIDWLRGDPRLEALHWKESFHTADPFHRMKVKLKKEIVTMGIDDIDPTACVGCYATPQQWNALIDDPECLVVDTRNAYEVAIGSFRGAVNPATQSFRDFPQWVRDHLKPDQHKKIAMFCTGGIRCEKSTSFLLSEGFEAVWHLQGGILKYLEEVPETESRWEGECFVFDARVAVNHRLEKGSFDQCYACRHPITEDDKRSVYYEKGVCCPRCYQTLTDDQQARFRERQKQVELAAKGGYCHIGGPPPARQTSMRAAELTDTPKE
ncbi:MAG: rhodanese-related sulfurtransferase [Luminiphilus sp.]|nr:rhodanese-related sulfurtransferase [Luminiphilus sp.]